MKKSSRFFKWFGGALLTMVIAVWCMMVNFFSPKFDPEPYLVKEPLSVNYTAPVVGFYTKHKVDDLANYRSGLARDRSGQTKAVI